MWDKSIFVFYLCNKDEIPIKDEKGEVKTVVFINETFKQAKERFNNAYPDLDYFKFIEYNDKEGIC